MDIIKQLLLQFILILVNALFAATEIAMVSVNEKKVRAQAESGDKKAGKLLRVIENPTGFLSAIQVCITLAGFLGSAFAADNFAERLTRFAVERFSLAAHAELIDTVSVILITLILSYFTLVLGELVPKRIAMKYKDKLARAMCSVLSFLAKVLAPVIWFLTLSTNAVLRLFGIKPNEKEESVSEEDIVIMLDAGADEGTLKQDDIEYIKNVFKLEHRSAADVMTLRSAMVAVSRDASEEELLALIESEGYSRIPVYEKDIDHIVGILHAKTYLLLHAREGFCIEDAIHEVDFVPETVSLDVLFKSMQQDRKHMVIVVNEYGMTLGVVTMEDIIEELVGEIWDEHDEVTTAIVAEAENTYRVRSDLSLDEFFEFFEVDADEQTASTTVNGWLTERCGCIPNVGDTLTYEGLSVSVIEADDLMTHEVRVERLPEAQEERDTEKAE